MKKIKIFILLFFLSFVLCSCNFLSTEEYEAEIIELANKIRAARLLFQEDSNKVPNWNELRVEVQRLQNKCKNF
jgi:hypothetical protein